MTDKQCSMDDLVSQLESGMTIGIGGWGSRRKPMAFVRALLHSQLNDLTIVSYGGPDVGLLAASGKVRRVICGFVTLDSIPLDPLWRKVREAGAIELTEVDEGLFFLGLQAAAWRVPFLPARAGLGSVVVDQDAGIRTVDNPYSDGPFADAGDVGASFVAMPALRLDAAVIHTNLADTAGNAAITGPDGYFDDLFLGAATRRFVTAEAVVENGTMTNHVDLRAISIHRLLTDAVVAAPRGAHFTSCVPDYERDEVFQKAYATAAKSEETWTAFDDRFLSGSEADYHDAVAAYHEEQA